MGLWRYLVDMAEKSGKNTDPVLRQELIKLYSLIEVNRLSIQRAKDPKQRTGAEPNIGQLTMSGCSAASVRSTCRSSAPTACCSVNPRPRRVGRR